MFVLHKSVDSVVDLNPGQKVIVLLLYWRQSPLGFAFALPSVSSLWNSGQKGIRPCGHLQNSHPSAGSPAACNSSCHLKIEAWLEKRNK